MTTSPLLRSLRELDPDRGHHQIPPTAQDAELLAILDSPRRAPRSRPAVLRSARSRALVGATAGLVAVLTVAGILSPWSNTPAFASWTAVPAALSASEVTARVEQCPQQYPTPDGTGRALEPVLVDVRGDYSFVIFSDGALVVQCYLETASDTGAVLASTAQAGPLRHQLGDAVLTTESNGVTTWASRGGGAIALAFGRADEDVTAVEASLPDGRVVTATVENGWWGMWAPGDAALPGTATVTRTDGSRTDLAISQD